MDHSKRASNAKTQNNHLTDPIFGIDGPQRTTTGPTKAIFGFWHLSRIIGVGLRVPQVKKLGFFFNNLAQGLKSINRLGRTSSGPLGPIHAKDGVCAMIILVFSVTSPF